jgi:NADPH2:quinone reductase
MAAAQTDGRVTRVRPSRPAGVCGSRSTTERTALCRSSEHCAPLREFAAKRPAPPRPRRPPLRAALITDLTGPDGVEIHDVPEPDPAPGRVLIDVHYAGVVFPDLLQTRGEYQMRPELPFTPGWEVAGLVREDANGFRAGDRVAAMPVIGGFAETVALDAEMVFPLPDELPLDKGAALPLNYLTGHFALHRRARLQAAETVLVHGAAGGVGTAACQIAAAHDARVIAVVSTPAKGEVARAAGAHHVVSIAGFRDQVSRLTEGKGVDVVVDPVGGGRFTDSLRCLAVEGRLIVLGFTGREIPTVKVNRLLLNNTTVMGAASEEFWHSNPGYVGQQWQELLPLIHSGALDPPIGEVFELDDAASALRAMDERRAAGRLLVRVRNPADPVAHRPGSLRTAAARPRPLGG